MTCQPCEEHRHEGCRDCSKPIPMPSSTMMGAGTTASYCCCRRATHPEDFEDYDQRRAALLELATLVHNEDGKGPLSPCVPLLISDLADSPDCFDGLLAAVGERWKFDADPRGYADTLDLRPTEKTLDAVGERLQEEIDYWLDRLVKA